MSKNRLFILVFVVFVILLTLASLPLYALDGTITYFAGDVRVERSGRTLQGEIGMPVLERDRVHTGTTATAIITLENNVDIKLRADTVLDMESLSEEVRVRLVSGSIFSKVKRKLIKSYSVEADTVLAGVRGTEFFIAYGRKVEETPDIWLCVNEGSVEVSVEGITESAIVKEGEGINIVAGKKLTKAKKYPWTRDLNWNTEPGEGSVEDNTDLGKAYSDLLDQDYD
jgi:hypothetical protein